MSNGEKMEGRQAISQGSSCKIVEDIWRICYLKQTYYEEESFLEKSDGTWVEMFLDFYKFQLIDQPC